MDAPTPPSDPSASPPEVTSQTLSWIIITLALNAMTQPCGRVIGLESRYRFYLRSSPLICVVDILFLFLRWMYLPVRLGLSITEAFKFAVLERFDDLQNPEENHQVAISLTWTRWLLFVLGPLPQAIRLASFQGVFWSKVIGFSFLASWLVMEISILLAAGMHGPEKGFFGYKGYHSHIDDHGLIIFLPFIAMLVPLVYICAVTLLAMMSDIKSALGRTFLGLFCAYIFAMTFPGFFFGLSSIGELLFDRYMWLGRNLLVVFPEIGSHGQAELRVDLLALAYLIIFLENVVMLVIGYSRFYNPDGTLNPGWNGVFG